MVRSAHGQPQRTNAKQVQPPSPVPQVHTCHSVRQQLCQLMHLQRRTIRLAAPQQVALVLLHCLGDTHAASLVTHRAAKRIAQARRRWGDKHKELLGTVGQTATRHYKVLVTTPRQLQRVCILTIATQNCSSVSCDRFNTVPVSVQCSQSHTTKRTQA